MANKPNNATLISSCWHVVRLLVFVKRANLARFLRFPRMAKIRHGLASKQQNLSLKCQRGRALTKLEGVRCSVLNLLTIEEAAHNPCVVAAVSSAPGGVRVVASGDSAFRSPKGS